jgi:hypothetical protein
MKIQWSNFLSLILLLMVVGCGSEEFGTVPKSTTSTPDSITSYTQSSCSTYTLIKPKVDVLYVVDNSSSSYYIANDIKTALSNTVKSLSSDFDFRVVGTQLIATPNGNNDYQVLTNSPDLQGIPSDTRKISSAGDFTFFATPSSGVERGLGRIVDFVSFHRGNLLRNNAYLVIVLVSNGRDLEVEEDAGFGNGETKLNTAMYSGKLSALRTLKSQMSALQLRLFSVTAKNTCVPGYRTALKSYVKMSTDLYTDSLATDNEINKDSYDLCSSVGVTSIFTAINNSIKKVVLPHQYRYWPITFANSNEMVDLTKVKVQKVGPNGSSLTLTKDVEWFYENKNPAAAVNTRELPTPGEPYTGSHFIRFANPIVYPDCVLVTSVSKTEYFGYIVLPQQPKFGTVSVRINGRPVPKSATNGWSDLSLMTSTRNIKVPYPNQGDENPPIIRTGYMLQLNGSQNYYKSGDAVEVNYLPTGI